MMPATIGTLMPACRRAAVAEPVEGVVVEEQLGDDERSPPSSTFRLRCSRSRVAVQALRVPLGVAGDADAEVVATGRRRLTKRVGVGEPAPRSPDELRLAPAGGSPRSASTFRTPAFHRSSRIAAQLVRDVCPTHVRWAIAADASAPAGSDSVSSSGLARAGAAAGPVGDRDVAGVCSGLEARRSSGTARRSRRRSWAGRTRTTRPAGRD